jgi:uncharacterized protein (DUF1810 family)
VPESFDLNWFLEAQEPIMPLVLEELCAGQKRSHWMWYIFPQLAGLGRSRMARHYAIPSICEARDYLTHPVLGQRLIECTRLVNQTGGRSALAVFGSPDDLKFHSSMTLFDRVHPGSVFTEALDTYFHSIPDPRTMKLLSGATVGRS